MNMTQMYFLNYNAKKHTNLFKPAPDIYCDITLLSANQVANDDKPTVWQHNNHQCPEDER